MQYVHKELVGTLGTDTRFSYLQVQASDERDRRVGTDCESVLFYLFKNRFIDTENSRSTKSKRVQVFSTMHVHVLYI